MTGIEMIGSGIACAVVILFLVTVWAVLASGARADDDSATYGGEDHRGTPDDLDRAR